MLYDTELVPAYAAVVSAFARKIDNHVTNRSRRERFAGMPNVCLRAPPPRLQRAPGAYTLGPFGELVVGVELAGGKVYGEISLDEAANIDRALVGGGGRRPARS